MVQAGVLDSNMGDFLLLMLAIDTATKSGSVALLERERIIAARYFDAGLEHSRRLFVEIDDMLRHSQRQAGDLEGVAVSIGPGSYTGLRIGLSAAKGLCLASGAALVTVSTLDAIAAALPHCNQAVCAVVEARSGEVCWALYDTSDGTARATCAPRIDSVVEALQSLPQTPVIICGEGAVAFVELVQDFPHCRCAPEPNGKPQACYVAHLGHARLMAGESAQLESAEPEYMRTPNYETVVEQRSRKASATVGGHPQGARS